MFTISFWYMLGLIFFGMIVGLLYAIWYVNRICIGSSRVVEKFRKEWTLDIILVYISILVVSILVAYIISIYFT